MGSRTRVLRTSISRVPWTRSPGFSGIGGVFLLTIKRYRGVPGRVVAEAGQESRNWTIVQFVDSNAKAMGVRPTLHGRRKQQTRGEIVRAAFELFGQHGYEDVSMDSVAEAAGVSRATLFNYFPQKELILREIAAARVAKLKAILEEFRASGKKARYDDIVELMVRLTVENARISGGSKKLFMETMFRQASQGVLLVARAEAVAALAESVRRFVKGEKKARRVAETAFAIYMATMLEWLMRESAPQKWLVETMRERLLVLREGVA
jgi:AcrR family transcriptional regulator